MYIFYLPLNENNMEEKPKVLPSYLMSSVWNAALEDQEKREVKPREKLWASELGGSAIDLYHKLKGVVPSNPPNARSLRKFEAGNIFEWIVSLVLKRANILVESQRWAQYQYEGLLPVSGKADFIAGSTPDFGKGHEFVDFLKRAEVPDVFLRCFDRVLDHIKKTFPNGLDEMPVEVKSISSFAADLMERTEQPIERHAVQLFHYLISMGFQKGLLVYVCRDDLRMFEFVIERNNPIWEQKYKSAIEKISKYYYAGEMPPKEPMLVFEGGKFSKNFNIEYSGYLTLIYGFKEPREYSEVYGKKATNWTRVLKRVKDAKKMTPKNEEVLAEIRESGYNIEELVALMPDTPIEEEEVVE